MLNMTMQNYNKNLNTADNLDDNITTIVNYERNSSVENTKWKNNFHYKFKTTIKRRCETSPKNHGLNY